jgi:hypothetical protein
MNRADYMRSLSNVTGFDETDVRRDRERVPMKIHNLNIRIAYPESPPDVAKELQSYLVDKYGGREIDKSMLGVVQKDVARFVASKWQPLVTVEPA